MLWYAYWQGFTCSTHSAQLPTTYWLSATLQVQLSRCYNWPSTLFQGSDPWTLTWSEYSVCCGWGAGCITVPCVRCWTSLVARSDGENLSATGIGSMCSWPASRCRCASFVVSSRFGTAASNLWVTAASYGNESVQAGEQVQAEIEPIIYAWKSPTLNSIILSDSRPSILRSWPLLPSTNLWHRNKNDCRCNVRPYICISFSILGSSNNFWLIDGRLRIMWRLRK